MAVEDFGSKPMIKVSIGTKIPPPPTPPTLPNAAPKNPITDPTTSLQPNAISWTTKELVCQRMISELCVCVCACVKIVDNSENKGKCSSKIVVYSKELV